jgi:hypothetical protein
MTIFFKPLKDIEIILAIASTLFGIFFILIDIFRSLPSLLTYEVEENTPIPSFLIVPVSVGFVISLFSVWISGGRERDILTPLVRSIGFAVVPLLPGSMFRSADTLLSKLIFTCFVPIAAIIVEVTLLDSVIRSCQNQCSSSLTDNSLVKQLLFFSALDFLNK